MRRIDDMPTDTASAIRGIFCDIDDTLTTNGRMHADAYLALERLFDAGLAVVPVTGRPAGWCDMIARFWPVSGVIGENGAFYFAHDHQTRTMKRVFFAPKHERAENRRKLDALAKQIIAAVPGAAVSADQLFREADLAIDFREDVTPLPQKQVDHIRHLFEAAGAVAKVSSIHVNGWFGAYDKLTMARRFARERLKIDLDAGKDAFVFVGDSPNDASMFAFFPNACGVANVRDFAGRLAADPAYVADARGGAGFVEITERILAAQRSAD